MIELERRDERRGGRCGHTSRVDLHRTQGRCTSLSLSSLITLTPPSSPSSSSSSTTMNPDDPRLGSIIQPGDGGEIVIVGYPHDEGVRRNGGRIGAAAAPAVVRGFLQKVGTVVNPEHDIDLKTISISDIGDIDANLPLEAAHELLHSTVRSILAQGKIPFVIGGGNDQSFPNGNALLKHYRNNVGIINIDAHLDVRPLKDGQAHSGSPFRQLLETEEYMQNEETYFVEFAAQGSQCSAAHAAFVKENSGTIIWLSDLKKKQETVGIQFQDLLKTMADKNATKLFVSFDVDSISSADCPGVSAPAAIGLTAQDALDICFIAGGNPNVKLFDLSEFNPKIEDYRTGRLVAFMFYYFALGVAARKKSNMK